MGKPVFNVKRMVKPYCTKNKKAKKENNGGKRSRKSKQKRSKRGKKANNNQKDPEGLINIRNPICAEEK